MEEIIVKYLDKNFKFTLSTLNSYKLFDRTTKENVYLTTVWNDVELIFGLSKEEFEPIWDKWAENHIININNKITDIRYKLYELNGNDLLLSVEDINTLLMSENK
jgi:hypothetical protein